MEISHLLEVSPPPWKMLQQKRFIRKRFLSKIILWAIYFWSNRPVINLKKINQYIPSSQTISNGESAITERYPQAGRLHMLSGSKRCIFLHRTSGGIEESGRGRGRGYINSCVYALDLPLSLTFLPNQKRF